MRTHIDWLTFTLAPRWASVIPEGGFDEAYANALSDAFYETFGQETVIEAFAGTWLRRERSRAPYTDAWEIEASGITVFASPALNHFCVEISGAGCERLIDVGALNSVLLAAQERVTRIDIATDIETDVKPSEFVKTLSHARMRASGYQVSETGETNYVGSQKSDRYARVYRYNAPHPRSHLLRVEHVFRREYAKIVAREVCGASVEEVASAAGKAFGWEHEVWQPSAAQHSDISIVSANRTASNTVFWLANTCGSAFRRLVSSGDIKDPVEFLERYFLPEE